ncbi:MAG: HAMP domain-containing histidine kinase [Phycisphaerae bacterium]|nr:MAG: sensor histidine kinase [Planctomycetota bacterium]KAB2949085.1 MAG: HAMP domain-containing histidine kinase [Phycisphaerae bacterium]MBE7457118.1 HAMP domain-containing histidine kinase [Planctomycetia bacterium]MCK6463523.1 HAMP domain-containing histidine kinase [Phycisphaerae bacterium]MCL4719005.1 HAMP domain-containing histidine kinase [Phycisphaerae bacterium]
MTGVSPERVVQGSGGRGVGGPPPDPELAEMLHSFNAVTERLKQSHETLGREVRRLREQLEEKDRELERGRRLSALGEMAAGVAHEIRNPLGGIGLYASMLAEDLKSEGKHGDVAQRILAGVKHLDALLTDILMFAGHVEPRKGAVLLGDVVQEVVELTAPQARLRDIRVDVDAAVLGERAEGDARQLSRAVLNLLLNALDAARPGGRVRIGAASDVASPGCVGIVVEDDGEGIAEGVLDRMFDPFFTTKETGTGLGLAIVHRIAEAHGGRISAFNRPEGGARFILWVRREGGAEESTRESSGASRLCSGKE